MAGHHTRYCKKGLGNMSNWKPILWGVAGAFVLLAAFQVFPALSRNTLGRLPTINKA
jgi:hypothetical protein